AKFAIGRPACMRPESLIGMPTSCEIVELSSAERAFSPSEIFCRYSARRAGGVAAQASSAPRAALTAAAMSFSPPAGTLPITAPVPALGTSMASLEEGATHWPPMKSLSRRIMEESGCATRERYFSKPPTGKARLRGGRVDRGRVQLRELGLDVEAPEGT